MGCDIHTAISYTGPTYGSGGPWMEGITDLPFSRNYTLFALMAGVRNYSDDDGNRLTPVAEPRGYPMGNVGYKVHEYFTYFVHKPGQPKDGSHNGRDVEYSTAAGWTEGAWSNDACYFTDYTKRDTLEPHGDAIDWDSEGAPSYGCYVTNPDFHTPSWLSLREMFIVRRRYKALCKQREWGEDSEAIDQLDIIIGIMSALDKKGKEPKFIFAFDN